MNQPLPYSLSSHSLLPASWTTQLALIHNKPFDLNFDQTSPQQQFPLDTFERFTKPSANPNHFIVDTTSPSFQNLDALARNQRLPSAFNRDEYLGKIVSDYPHRFINDLNIQNLSDEELVGLRNIEHSFGIQTTVDILTHKKLIGRYQGTTWPRHLLLLATDIDFDSDLKHWFEYLMRNLFSNRSFRPSGAIINILFKLTQSELDPNFGFESDLGDIRGIYYQRRGNGNWSKKPFVDTRPLRTDLFREIQEEHSGEWIEEANELKTHLVPSRPNPNDKQFQNQVVAYSKWLEQSEDRRLVYHFVGHPNRYELHLLAKILAEVAEQVEVKFYGTWDLFNALEEIDLVDLVDPKQQYRLFYQNITPTTHNPAKQEELIGKIKNTISLLRATPSDSIYPTPIYMYQDSLETIIALQDTLLEQFADSLIHTFLSDEFEFIYEQLAQIQNFESVPRIRKSLRIALENVSAALLGPVQKDTVFEMIASIQTLSANLLDLQDTLSPIAAMASK